MPSDLTIGLSKVRNRFLEMLVERLQRLDVLHDDIRSNQNAGASIKEVGEIAHKIAGTAGTLGFRALGEIAIETDLLVQDTVVNGLAASDRLDRQIARLCDECRVELSVSNAP